MHWRVNLHHHHSSPSHSANVICIVGKFTLSVAVFKSLCSGECSLLHDALCLLWGHLASRLSLAPLGKSKYCLTLSVQPSFLGLFLWSVVSLVPFDCVLFVVSEAREGRWMLCDSFGSNGVFERSPINSEHDDESYKSNTTVSCERIPKLLYSKNIAFRKLSNTKIYQIPKCYPIYPTFPLLKLAQR